MREAVSPTGKESKLRKGQVWGQRPVANNGSGIAKVHLAPKSPTTDL
jgi:hypothetical protein